MNNNPPRNLNRPLGNKQPGFPQKVSPMKRPLRPPFEKNVRPQELKVVNKQAWELKNFGLALGVASGMILLQLLIMAMFNLGPKGSSILGFFMFVLFAAFIYFTLEPNALKLGNLLPSKKNPQPSKDLSPKKPMFNKNNPILNQKNMPAKKI